VSRPFGNRPLVNPRKRWGIEISVKGIHCENRTGS